MAIGDKTFHDSDGNLCDLSTMVLREPGWAVSRIQEERRQLDALRVHLAHAYADHSCPVVREVCELLGESPPPSVLGFTYDPGLHLWRGPRGESMEGPPPPAPVSSGGTGASS